MIVYISGGMTGIKDNNYPLFNQVAQTLREGGYIVINPAENFGGDRNPTRAQFMRLDISHVLHADMIVVLPGWFNHKGARTEVQVAFEIGLDVVEYQGAGKPFRALPLIDLTRSAAYQAAGPNDFWEALV